MLQMHRMVKINVQHNLVTKATIFYITKHTKSNAEKAFVQIKIHWSMTVNIK